MDNTARIAASKMGHVTLIHAEQSKLSACAIQQSDTNTSRTFLLGFMLDYLACERHARPLAASPDRCRDLTRLHPGAGRYRECLRHPQHIQTDCRKQ